MSEAVEAESGPETESGPGPVSPIAAMAIGLRKGRADSRPDPEFDAFLRKQSRLIDLQTEHLHEQRGLVISRLRWGRFSDRMKALLQVMTAAVGVGLVLAIGVMAWSASRDRSLVIEPFTAPPVLADRGVTGQVVADDVMQRMEAIRRPVTGTISAATTQVTADSKDEVKLELPETGVSIGDLWRALRHWLGAQRLIDGSLRQDDDGMLRLEAHLAGHDPVSALGSPAELEALEQKVAEQLFAQVDPENWANYLVTKGRKAEALAAMQRLPALAADGADRADAYALWADHTRDPVRARALAMTAVEIDPKVATGWLESGRREQQLGHDERSLANFRRSTATRNQDQSSEVRGQGFRFVRDIAAANISVLTGDFAGRDRKNPRWRQSAGGLAELAPTAVGLHDGPMAREWLAEAQALGGPEPVLANIRLSAGMAGEDWPAAAREAAQQLAPMEQARATAPQDEAAGLWWDEQVTLRPRLAEARLRLGDLAGAEAAIAPTPLDCYGCVRERGRIAAAAHDWARAERWFAEAVRQGPSLPFAYADWGKMLLERGEPDAATAKLRLALDRSPRFPDAMALWAEALMAKRDHRAAAAKFAETARVTPKWGRLHLKWGEALMLAGRYREARAQYETASGLDLSRPDRAALTVLLDRTSKGALHG